MRRLLVRTLAVLLVLAIAAVSVGYLLLRRSLPDFDEDAHVRGITGAVDIVRDADAVPHIFASNALDGLFGLGYVHAQDRLWQMEFQRRIGHGRLSEIFGAATIPQDRFLRTVGFGRAARSAWDHLPGEAREQIDAYVAGVNAFIDAHGGTRLPPEFQLLRFEPEPFTGPDVLVWVKMMAWDLSANYSYELMRGDMLRRLSPEQVSQLMPPYPADGLSILNDRIGPSSDPAAASGPAATMPEPHTATAGAPGERAAWSAFVDGLSTGHPAVARMLLTGATHEAIGSNNWVVDGTLTATGKPLLANDPHLGTHVPSIWYLAHVSAGDVDMIGATLPGTPAVALGRNRSIAWGATNVAADVQDLYRERLDPTGRFAEFRGAQEPLRILKETVKVKGSDPVEVEVRISRHGPLISDAINANNAASETRANAEPLEPLAFRWTALDDEDLTVLAFLRLNQARNWDEITAALKDYNSPSQNFVFADVAGHIGYYAPGHIPIRASGDGSRPAEGWTGEAEWVGFVPFERLPHVYDPPDHFIVTANNRPSAALDAPLVGLEYPTPYRAQRIVDLLREISATKKLTPDDLHRIQADTLSLHARDLLPRLLRHAAAADPLDRAAVEILNAWDDDARGDAAAPAIFEAWFLRLAEAVAGDELGSALDGYRGRFSHVTRFLEIALDAHPEWCDVVSTPPRETCEEVVTAALHAGVADLTGRLGSDPHRWRWDAVHTAVFPHQGLDAVGPLRPLLSRSRPNGGDWSTVNVGPVAADALFEQRSVPGYRTIVDLSPANDSRFLDAVGQSGHFLSRHYDDFLDDWMQVRYRKMRMERRDVDAQSLGHLRLTPE
ncbi:MAG: penicillin acylase family protein [Vicinamibacterales bacterium]